jgi:hypothetical protein
VLEKFQFPYVTLHNADIIDGLHERIDVLVIPSIDPKQLREGYGAAETEPAYVGGLGRGGADAIREFVRKGGSLVCFENASRYAIEELGLPVNDVLKGVANSAFYGPGSILRIRYDVKPNTLTNTHPILWGMPDEGHAYFDHSLAFEAKGESTWTVLARYAPNNVLESGWLLGAEKVQGKAAILNLDYEKGRVLLFGFPPQHRGQTHGTLRVLFNCFLDVARES